MVPTQKTPSTATPTIAVYKLLLTNPSVAFRAIVFLLLTTCLFASRNSLASQPLDHEKQAPTLTRFTFTEYHMGVDARLVVYAPNQAVAENACTAAFQRMADLDQIMSDYRPSSELMQLCDKAGGPAVHVSTDLFKVLKQAQTISLQSNGYFDISVGPVIKLWRAARKTHVKPSPASIAAARQLVGWQSIKLDEKSQTVRLLKKGMRLDLGAIGKGYADDEAQKVLKKFGITHALVDMGGDIVVSEAPPGKKGWMVKIPNGKENGSVPELPIVNQAISSSGDTEEFVIIGGVRYSHVIDPHTGMPLTKGVQATIIAPFGTLSDPLCTALTLLSPPARARLLKNYPTVKSFIRTYKAPVDSDRD